MNLLIILFAISQLETSSPRIAFDSQMVDTSLPGAYQVAIVDIDNDDRLDIAALGDGKDSGVFWYKNPTWERYPISGPEITNPIDLAFYDINGDSKEDMALVYEFGMDRTSSGGAIAWLERQEDLAKHWISHKIGEEPTAHRLRWLNWDQKAKSKKELIVAPIMGRDTKGPDFDQDGIRLLSFTIPENPSTQPWPMEVVDESLHIAHALMVKESYYPEIFIGSSEGITRFSKAKGLFGFSTEKELIWKGSKGFSSLSDESRVSEIASGGRLYEKYFYVTIEPWHGNKVMVYTQAKDRLLDQGIDVSLNNGHALACADFDQDGDDEIIAGYRGEGHTIYLYDFDSTTGNWNRQVIDKDVAAQGFFVADVNEDGWMDFATAGGSTHNVKLYINKSNKE